MTAFYAQAAELAQAGMGQIAQNLIQAFITALIQRINEEANAN